MSPQDRLKGEHQSAQLEGTPVNHQPAPRREPTLAWEDFPIDSVREFGATPVTREAIVEFATRFDPQYFHVDDEAARSSLFGGLCASGWHTCAMTMRMICDGYLLDSASLGAPGVENVRWQQPVFPGDVLSVRTRVLDARLSASRPGVGLLRTGWEVLNQRGEIVMTMQGWGMMRTRDGLGAAAPSAAPG